MKKFLDRTNQTFESFMSETQRLARKEIDPATYDKRVATLATLLDCDLDDKKIEDAKSAKMVVRTIDAIRNKVKECEEYGGAHIIAKMFVDAIDNMGENSDTIRAELVAQMMTHEFNNGGNKNG